jgi:hypothetical protein
MRFGAASFVVVTLALLAAAGCKQSGDDAKPAAQAPPAAPAPAGQPVSQIVEAACGMCKFDLAASGCGLAVRIDGVAYEVEGANMDDHGDAHGADGMCNVIRRARVVGAVTDGRFVATSFELLPVESGS